LSPHPGHPIRDRHSLLWSRRLARASGWCCNSSNRVSRYRTFLLLSRRGRSRPLRCVFHFTRHLR
jgi:hypothetical protein